MDNKDNGQLAELVERCGKIARSKGFNPRLPATQLAQVASEVGEAMEELYVPLTCDSGLRQFVDTIKEATYKFQVHRSNTGNRCSYIDDSMVVDNDAYMRELSDICVAVFSHVSTVGLTDEFIYTLYSVVDANELRPHKHNKRF